MKRIVIAGIHTEVGKTIVSAIVAEALQARYWKPIQCGLPSDRQWVEQMLSSRGRCYPERYCLKTPCSPHLAAEREGVRIAAEDLVPPECAGPLVIEGTGGIFAPLNTTQSWIDAAVHWDAEWILVYGHYLGSFNHFLMTVECLKQRGISLLGIVFNGETEEMLIKRARTQQIGRLAWEENWTPSLVKGYAEQWSEALGL